MKIIKGLECHQIDNNHRISCADCPYYVDDDNHIRCVNDLHDDAIALLKEQEDQIKNRDESLEKAREEIKWLRGMLKEQEAKRKNRLPYSPDSNVQWT